MTMAGRQEIGHFQFTAGVAQLTAWANTPVYYLLKNISSFKPPTTTGGIFHLNRSVPSHCKILVSIYIRIQYQNK